MTERGTGTAREGEKVLLRAPSLSYSWLRQDGIEVVGAGPLLHSVQEVTAHLIDDRLHVYARGQMLRRDGSPSRVHRSRDVRLDAEQPTWLADIIEDIYRRLPEAAHRGSSEEGGR